MADQSPNVGPIMEIPTENPNDVKTKRNKTTREQYYGGYQETTMAGAMTQ
jgi:hypothetical protein